MNSDCSQGFQLPASRLNESLSGGLQASKGWEGKHGALLNAVAATFLTKKAETEENGIKNPKGESMEKRNFCLHSLVVACTCAYFTNSAMGFFILDQLSLVPVPVMLTQSLKYKHEHILNDL